MRRPQGYSQMWGPGLAHLTDPGLAALHKDGECDTFTCAHCNSVVFVPPFTDPADIGGGCRICDGLICNKCVDLRACSPFEAKLERQLERAHRMRGYV